MKIHTARLMTGAPLALALCLGGAPAAWAADLLVNTLNDADDGTDGVCSLREAIHAANGDDDYNECIDTDDYGDDTITFGVSGTIGLGSTLPAITDGAGLTIDGTDQSVTVSGQDAVRVMFVDGGALRLEHLRVANGRTGTSGEFLDISGGGVLNQGSLTVTHSTFSGNSAGGTAAASTTSAPSPSPSPTAPFPATARRTAAASATKAASPSPTAPSRATPAAASRTGARAASPTAPSRATARPSSAAASSTTAR